MLLSAKNVSRSFGSLVALSDATLDVEEGEIIGLIGPNGAGKSTFFNCIAGDIAPSSGSVHFSGTDVTDAPPEAHAALGMRRRCRRQSLVAKADGPVQVIHPVGLAEHSLVDAGKRAQVLGALGVALGCRLQSALRVPERLFEVGVVKKQVKSHLVRRGAVQQQPAVSGVVRR